MPSGRWSTSSAAVSPPLPSRRLPGQSRTVWLLGLGAFGLAYSLTTTAAYLPPFLGTFTDSETLIALVLAGEGLFALSLPLVIGPWSDTFHTPMGRRRPFMLVALLPLAFCLALLAFMPSLWTAALIVFAFFFAYYVYEPPYRGLYPDLLPGDVFGRAQGVQHLLRGVALGIALVGGGLLFTVWHPWPFLVAAAVVLAACSAPILWLREDGGHGRVFEGVRVYVRHSWRVLRREPAVAKFLLANSAWEGTFAGARTFVVLYVTVGLGEPIGVSSAVLGAVAAGYVVAALVAGRLGDRFGLAKVIYVCSVVYGVGLLAGGLAREWHLWYLLPVAFVAVAGGAVMTLAWGLLFKLMPPAERGAVAGLATTTKGFGLLIGPLLAGGAIDVLAPVLEETHGYQVLWPVLGVPILLVLPLVRSLAKSESAADGHVLAHQPEGPDLVVRDVEDADGPAPDEREG